MDRKNGSAETREAPQCIGKNIFFSHRFHRGDKQTKRLWLRWLRRFQWWNIETPCFARSEKHIFWRSVEDGVPCRLLSSILLSQLTFPESLSYILMEKGQFSGRSAQSQLTTVTNSCIDAITSAQLEQKFSSPANSAEKRYWDNVWKRFLSKTFSYCWENIRQLQSGINY